MTMAKYLPCVIVVVAAGVLLAPTLDRWGDMPTREIAAGNGSIEAPIGCKTIWGEGIDMTVGEVRCKHNRELVVEFRAASNIGADFSSQCKASSHPKWMVENCASRHGHKICCSITSGGNDRCYHADGTRTRHGISITVEYPTLGPTVFEFCAVGRTQALAALELVSTYDARPRKF